MRAELLGVSSFWICVRDLVVDSMRSTGACTTELVDRDPSEDLVIGPGVAVCPIMQLLIDPRQQCYRGIIESICQGLRLGGLLQVVAYSVITS